MSKSIKEIFEEAENIETPKKPKEEIINVNPTSNILEEIINEDKKEINTTDEAKKTDEEGEISEKIDPKKIHTLYYIKSGVLHKGDVISELSKKNYKYRLYSLIEGIAVIDYDKTDARPLVKDILNRMNEFLEIKLLKRNFWITLGIICLLIFNIWRTYNIKPADIQPLASGMIDIGQKVEFLYNMEKAKNIVSTGSTSETKDSGYSPVYPKKNTSKITQ